MKITFENNGNSKKEIKCLIVIKKYSHNAKNKIKNTKNENAIIYIFMY